MQSISELQAYSLWCNVSACRRALARGDEEGTTRALDFVLVVSQNASSPAVRCQADREIEKLIVAPCVPAPCLPTKEVQS